MAFIETNSIKEKLYEYEDITYFPPDFLVSCMAESFSQTLLKWNRTSNRREMPWKGEKDPYRIWLSEVILQQTRVDQGLAYYNRFIDRFPDVRALALAPDDEIYKLWEGLGYYSRCRNLIATARYIAFELEGQFPGTYNDILQLKGVGAYTAAAISSFAFGLPHAVVDGNVIRVLSRIFGIDDPIEASDTRKIFFEKANEVLDRQDPAAHNQAIMDLGATVCKPRNPDCAICPFHQSCFAFQHGLKEKLPNKQRKLSRRKRYFHYLVFSHNGHYYLKKREGRDIWQNLFEFFLFEADKLLGTAELLNDPFFRQLMGNTRFELVQESKPRRQQLSHQEIEGRFFMIMVTERPPGLHSFESIPAKDLRKLALPRFIVSYLEENS